MASAETITISKQVAFDAIEELVRKASGYEQDAEQSRIGWEKEEWARMAAEFRSVQNELDAALLPTRLTDADVSISSSLAEKLDHYLRIIKDHIQFGSTEPNSYDHRSIERIPQILKSLN